MPDQQTVLKKVAEHLAELDRLAELGGGESRIQKQHEAGKLTARERMDLLFDPGSFEEIDKLVTHRCRDFGMDEQAVPGDGFVTGRGYVNGRLVFAFAQDFTVFGGSLSEANAAKIVKVMDLAMKMGAPVVGIPDSGGARIQEGVASLKGYGEIFLRNTLASGVVPQISVVMGPCAGGAVYSPAITDFVFMVQGTGNMYITGPDVIRAVTGEEVSHEDLGGAEAHSRRSGVCHFAVEGEENCLAEVRRLLAFLPSNNMEDPPRQEPEDDPRRTADDMMAVVPEDPSRPYDIHEVIYRMVDNGDFMEVHPFWAQSITVGFARMNGWPVGIVANNPLALAGVLDMDSSRKGARFVRFCDAFNVPIVTLVDVPGYLPGTTQEYGGIITHGAKLIYAYSEATVPKISVILRKAYGGAYVVMGSKHLRTDINYAWPTSEIAVMGPDGAVNIVFRREIEKAEDADEAHKRLVQEYRLKFANPYITASRGFIDDVIDPRETRYRIICALCAPLGRPIHRL